ncbi:MAG: LPS export ABC transporter periplasmic protein LptC [Bacteroidales bacterium]|nr:LPS export ABC transporter periplasmic protein LptC [Bacteroidales bacterium]
MSNSCQARLFIIVIFALSLTACENEIEKINLLNTTSEYPDMIGEDIETIYSDSAKVKVKMVAPELRQFNNAEKPYSEFPQGMKVTFFNDSLEIESVIHANYAIYYNDDKLWHATGNVVAENYATGERLDSEELFWDEEKEEIYSDSYTRIVNENGTFYGQKGFRSNQSLTDYTLIGSKGVVNINEDE